MGRITHGSLFSGIGGFDLAAAYCGWENIWQVEIDPFCRAVLQKHFPNTKRYEDIKNAKGLEAVDVISGGFPCQPFSVAGKQGGKEDNRYLWPEMLRIITEVKPTWIVGENVAGIINMELESVLASLEAEGYEVQPIIIPACAVNAPHRRDRVWILGHAKHNGSSSTTSRSDRAKRSAQRPNEAFESQRASAASNTNGSGCRERRRGEPIQSAHYSIEYIGEDDAISEINGLEKSRNRMEERLRFTTQDWWLTEPNVGRVADGIPARVDRLRSLGNAIVPQVALEIFKAINRVEGIG